MQHFVERLQCGRAFVRQGAADLGAAGHPHPHAEAGDGDLVALVHHRAARGVERFAQGCADGIAIHRRHRQLQAQRAQQRGGRYTGAQHHGIKHLGRRHAGQHQLGPHAGGDIRHRGVETELRAQQLGLAAQQQGELAAVAHAVVGQVDGAGKVGVAAQGGLDGPCGGIVELQEAGAGLAQHLQTGLHQLLVLGRAQQHGVAGAALVVQPELFGELVQAGPAVEGQALHTRPVGQVGGRVAGTQPAGHPGQVAGGQGPLQLDWRMPAEQVTQHFGRHARCGPGGDVAGGDHAGIGKAGFFGSGAAALEHGDFMAVGGQFIRGGDADDAGPHDGDFHEKRTR